MAVYTRIDKNLLVLFLKNYDLGSLISFTAIQEGVENTNYKIITTSGSYILTIFEKRVEEKDLPFFIELKKHLVKKKFLCPQPISNKKNIFINILKNKPCLITSFLKGKKINFIKANHCIQLGKQLAIMHNNTSDFKPSRKNSLSQKKWRKLFNNFQHKKNTNYNNLFNYINTELDFLDNQWPIKLPSGVIHADIFQDNVFFNNDVFSGIIDFYFACNDYFSYELAICINAWCFNKENEFQINNFTAFINSYQKIRKLTLSEKIALPILLRGAAMRFLLTRLNDIIFHSSEAYVEPKDPMEYFHILQFHQNNNFTSL